MAVAAIMKYLLALALVAVATAIPEPVRLLEPVQIAQPDIAPLMVPQEVMDQVATQVKIVDAPEAVEAVKIVDAPEDSDASSFAVNFVDVAPETAEAPVAPSAVKIIDIVADEDTPTYNPMAVKIVDNVDADEETPSYIPLDAPFQVKIIDMPLPDSVVMPLAEPVMVQDAPVENADFGEDVQSPVFWPMRPAYPNPMWR